MVILFHLLYLSSIFRGQEQCSIHNQAAYMKHCTQTTLDISCCLPPELITLATVPLPASYLFHEALLSEDVLDELQLQCWESGPPFTQPEPADTTEESQFTTNLMHVFLGQKLCLENQAKAHWKY